MRFLLLSTVISLSAFSLSPVSASFSDDEMDKAIANSIATAKAEDQFRADIAAATKLSLEEARKADIKAQAIESRNVQTTLLNSFATAKEENKSQVAPPTSAFERHINNFSSVRNATNGSSALIAPQTAEQEANDIRLATLRSLSTKRAEDAARNKVTAPSTPLARHVNHFATVRKNTNSSSALIAPQTAEQEANDIRLATLRSLSTKREEDAKRNKVTAPVASKNVAVKTAKTAVKDIATTVSASKKKAQPLAKRVVSAQSVKRTAKRAKIFKEANQSIKAILARSDVTPVRLEEARKKLRRSKTNVHRPATVKRVQLEAAKKGLRSAKTDVYAKPSNMVLTGDVREKAKGFNALAKAKAIRVN